MYSTRSEGRKRPPELVVDEFWESEISYNNSFKFTPYLHSMYLSLAETRYFLISRSISSSSSSSSLSFFFNLHPPFSQIPYPLLFHVLISLIYFLLPFLYHHRTFNILLLLRFSSSLHPLSSLLVRSSYSS
jgi:hypothetical protein